MAKKTQLEKRVDAEFSRLTTRERIALGLEAAKAVVAARKKVATILMYADEGGWLCSAYDGDVTGQDDLPEDTIADRFVDDNDSAAHRDCKCGEGDEDDEEHYFGEHMAFGPLMQELANLGYDRLVWDDRIFGYPAWAKRDIDLINKTGLARWKGIVQEGAYAQPRRNGRGN